MEFMKIYRESNKIADHLAKANIDRLFDYIAWLCNFTTDRPLVLHGCFNLIIVCIFKRNPTLKLMVFFLIHLVNWGKTINNILYKQGINLLMSDCIKKIYLYSMLVCFN
jgi:hypothetical protein